MNTRGLPGMFAPMYQEFASGYSVLSATSLTCWTQSRSASGAASIRFMPRARIVARQSPIQSICCSIATIICVFTDGLPGPVIVNMLGKPETISPR